MLMNQTIKSGDGVEYSIHKTMCGDIGLLYKFIIQTLPHVIEYWLSFALCLAQAYNNK